MVVAAALIGAIVWNLLTWRFGIPSSSSHALIGGLIGAAHRRAAASAALHRRRHRDKVLLPLFGSPMLGFVIGLLLHDRR